MTRSEIQVCQSESENLYDFKNIMFARYEIGDVFYDGNLNSTGNSSTLQYLSNITYTFSKTTSTNRQRWSCDNINGSNLTKNGDNYSYISVNNKENIHITNITFVIILSYQPLEFIIT